MRAARTLLAFLLLVLPAAPALAQSSDRYSSNEILDAGHRFFGGVSRGLATIIEKAVSQWGLPNGYVLGEEAGGAFVGGLRYGEGSLYTKNAGDLRVYWQGPTVGWEDYWKAFDEQRRRGSSWAAETRSPLVA